jgi:TRAP-type C4-dicarboxylate transport system substrate-binding protein
MDASQKQAFADAMKFYEDKAYAYNRALRDASMEQVKKRGIPVYVPSESEMKEWRAYGTQFMQSDVVRSSVNKETIDEAINAQR